MPPQRSATFWSLPYLIPRFKENHGPRNSEDCTVLTLKSGWRYRRAADPPSREQLGPSRPLMQPRPS